MIEIADRKGRTNMNTWGNETRSKKKARTNVECQNFPYLDCSKYLGLKESFPNDSNITKPYYMTDDKDRKVIMPGQDNISRQIQDLSRNSRNQLYKNVSDPLVVESVLQEFTVTKEIGKPLKNTKFAGIMNNFLADKMEDEKVGKLIKAYNMPKKTVKICQLQNALMGFEEMISKLSAKDPMP